MAFLIDIGWFAEWIAGDIWSPLLHGSFCSQFLIFFFKFLLCSIGESCCLSTQTFECLIVNCTSFAFRWHGALAQPLTFLHKRPSDSTLRYGFSIQMCGGKSSSQQVSQHHRFAFRRAAFFLAKCSMVFCCRFWHDYANMRNRRDFDVTFIDLLPPTPPMWKTNKRALVDKEKPDSQKKTSLKKEVPKPNIHRDNFTFHCLVNRVSVKISLWPEKKRKNIADWELPVPRTKLSF